MDLREFYTTPSGEFVPTKKGVMVPISKLSQVVTFIEQAEAQVDEFQSGG